MRILIAAFLFFLTLSNVVFAGEVKALDELNRIVIPVAKEGFRVAIEGDRIKNVMSHVDMNELFERFQLEENLGQLILTPKSNKIKLLLISEKFRAQDVAFVVDPQGTDFVLLRPAENQVHKAKDNQLEESRLDVMIKSDFKKILRGELKDFEDISHPALLSTEKDLLKKLRKNNVTYSIYKMNDLKEFELQHPIYKAYAYYFDKEQTKWIVISGN